MRMKNILNQNLQMMRTKSPRRRMLETRGARSLGIICRAISGLDTVLFRHFPFMRIRRLTVYPVDYRRDRLTTAFALSLFLSLLLFVLRGCEITGKRSALSRH